MNKKLNTALFFLVGTAVNLVITLVLALVVLVPYIVFLSAHMPSMVNLGVLALVFLGSMAGTLVIYRKLTDWFQTKVDMEKYFDPIVRQKVQPRR